MVRSGPTLDQVSKFTDIGGRYYQEDHMLALECGDGLLLAVMDGHRGGRTSEHCAQVLPGLAQEFSRADPTVAIQRIVDELFEETCDFKEGSTLSLAYITGTMAYTANVGDSPIIALGKGGASFRSVDHNAATNEHDRMNIEDRGGICDGGYISRNSRGPSLQLTRTLGDADFGNLLIRDGAFSAISLDEKSWVAVMSDGVLLPFEGMNDERVRRLIDEGASAESLAKEALAGGSDDNVTAIIWRA